MLKSAVSQPTPITTTDVAW